MANTSKEYLSKEKCDELTKELEFLTRVKRKMFGDDTLISGYLAKEEKTPPR